jgi:urease accessory protein
LEAPKRNGRAAFPKKRATRRSRFRYYGGNMKNAAPIRTLALLATALAVPTFARAHTGQTLVYDCASGLAHPFQGWDHLLAMLAVGILAAQHGGRARWLLPLTFIGVMACAATLSARGLALPGLETMIATSVLVFGVLIAVAARLPLAASVAIVGLFAVAHGVAHGAEIPADSTALSYGAGFVLSTALLHAIGLLLGHVGSLKSSQLPRLAGFACAAAGAVFLIA